MAQVALPDSDVSTGSWTATPLWSKINAVASQIQSADNTNPDTMECGLTDVTDPVSSSSHTIKYTIRKEATGGHEVNFVASLIQGTTVIATFTELAFDNASFEAFEHTISGAEADSITDYTDLRLRMARTGDTGGSPGTRRWIEIQIASFEVPSADPALAAPLINNIQEVSIVIAASGTSNTDTITSVNTARTMLIYNGMQISDDAGWLPDDNFARVTLTDSTTVTANVNTAAADDITIKCTVVEFVADVLSSVERGTVTIGTSATTGTDTITTVDTDNAFVNFLGHTSTESVNNNHLGDVDAYIELTNATTVTATRGAMDAGDTVTVSYEAIQINSNAVNNIQKVLGVIGAGGSEASTTETITTVDVDNTFLIYGGRTFDSATTAKLDSGYAELTDSTTVTFTRDRSLSSDTTIAVTVLEFNAGFIESVQRASAEIGSSQTQQNETITSVDTDNSLVNFLGDGYGNTQNAGDHIYCTVEITTSTNMLAERAASDSEILTLSYEVVEFSPAAVFTGYIERGIMRGTARGVNRGT